MYLNLAIYVNCERALSRIPIFLIGILLFNLINKDFNICIIIPIASIIFGGGIILLIILISPHIIIIRYLYGILSLCIILFYSWIRHIGGFKFIKVLFIFCGNASFEIYIIHVFALRILNSYDLWSNLQSWAWFLIIIVSSVILGYGYNYFVKKMEVFLNGKKDNYWNNNG